MLQGFPLPDFDCFDDDLIGGDPFEYDIINNHFSDLTDSEYETLIADKGLVIDKTTPIKCTGNSSVYAAKSRNGKMFAVKITDHKKRIHYEYNKRKQIKDSPYLLKSYSMKESPTKAMLQMELCENGDIKGLIMPESYIWKLIHDIGNALCQIHNDGWMHLDVSPTNILVGKNSFKLSDFGTLTKIGEFEEGSEGAGPYVSPEALAFPFGNYIVNQQTDIFSFGLVLLEAATGKPAPRGGTPGYSMIRNDGIKLGDQDYVCWCSDELVSVINSMLASNPNQRPSSQQLIELPSCRVFDM